MCPHSTGLFPPRWRASPWMCGKTLAPCTRRWMLPIRSAPVQALIHEGNKTTVFVVNGSGQLEDRDVQLGLQTASDAEIISGLNEGEQVVVSDRSSLKAGQKVQPQTVAVMQYQEENTK